MRLDSGWLAPPRRATRGVAPSPSKHPRKFVLAFAGAFVVAFAAPAVAQAPSPSPQALLHEYRCYICHSDAEAKAGPAYVDVAAKYRGRPGAVAKVAATIKRGSHGGGPWHMPPHPEVSDAEAKVMARYILSLKP
jgi:cytochrome c